MWLLKCPDDVLLNIAFHIYSDLHPESYCADFGIRYRIFGQLVRVCRRFHVLFTRLLYRTLCITHERNSGPIEYQNQWLQQNPSRKIMAALLRTLHAFPALGYYTHFLEISWDEYDNGPEDHKRINDYLGMFPLLRELDISALRQPHMNECLNAPRWALEFLHVNSFMHLRRLRISQPFSPDMLPRIFFLPNLQTLEVPTLDTKNIECWTLSREFIPGRSKVTNLSLFAILTPCQLLQILSWPAALESFVYIHEDYQISETHPPMPGIFSAALHPFRHTLTKLKVKMSDSYFNNTDSVDNKRQLYRPLLNPRGFLFLRELQVPSFFLLGLPGKGYDRSILSDLLPSSLSFLEICFQSEDTLNLTWNGWRSAYDLVGGFDWIRILGEQCKGWGRLPALKKVSIYQEGSMRSVYLPQDLKEIFLLQQVQINVKAFAEYVDGLSDSWPEEFQGDWIEDQLYGCRGGPVFGKEVTEYSDSPHGSEDDEDFIEDYIMEDESWEYFDEVRTEEKAKNGERWVRGQWPDYEETREEREEIFKYSIRGM